MSVEWIEGWRCRGCGGRVGFFETFAVNHFVLVCEGTDCRVGAGCVRRSPRREAVSCGAGQDADRAAPVGGIGDVAPNVGAEAGGGRAAKLYRTADGKFDRISYQREYMRTYLPKYRKGARNA
jgi:hypothetical protein